MTTLAPTAPWPDASASAGDGEADARWIRESLAGNSRGFESIVRAYHARIYRFLYHLTRRHHDAEDLTQQTFLKAFRALGQFDLNRPLVGWLFAIARNLALNHFRDAKYSEEIAPDLAAPEISPAESAERQDGSDTLWGEARRWLSTREFEILWLRFGENLSTRETARVVRLTEIHVKVLVHRARGKLLNKIPMP